MKLLVYVPILTPRIKYIFNFIFNDILKTQAGFSSNLSEFKDSALAKMSYADKPISDELFFRQTEFLLAHKVNPPTIKTTIFGDMIVPFAIDNSSLPFDVFAAAFYFVSRFEEYLPFRPDESGDFPAEYSLQSKLKVLEFPVIDAWALMLKNLLLKKYPDLYFGKKEFEYIPLLSMQTGRQQRSARLKAKLRGYFTKISALKAFQRIAEQPENGLQSFLNEQHKRYGLKPIYFNEVAEDAETMCDRQISFPKSYLHSIKRGALKDYRMGYSRNIGFRAGTCTPFLWYDLQLEKTTHLLVHPVAVNDKILRLNRTFNIDEVMMKWGRLMENVKLLNGHLYVLWHKDTLPDSGKGKIGRILYQQILTHYLTETDDIRLK